MHIKRIQAALIAGLLLLMLILPQLALAAGPEITKVDAVAITATTATITWLTNNASNSLVNYGITYALGNTKSDSSMVTEHNIPLESLFPGKTYYYEVWSGGVRSPAAEGEYHFFITGTLPEEYSITLDHACGVCGELIDVEVCGEVIGVTAIVAAAGTYHVCWDSLTNTKATFTASGAVIHTLAFFMPEAKKGDHKVYLTDNSYTQKGDYAIFTVVPSAKIGPEEGPVGTEVTVNCYGFPDNQAIRVEFDDTVITKDADKTNTVGSFTVSYTIPPTPADGYTFNIEAKEGTVWPVWVSKHFTVTPEITANPESGTVGQTIEISGTGFASEEEDIEVTFDEKVVKENIYADENGSWSTVIAVPALRSDRYIIDASGMLTRARDVPDVEFILGAGVSVEPGLAYVGDTITVTGGGFALGETGIDVTFAGTVATGITADMDGCWETSFVLPASTYGSHTVSACGDITKPAVTTTLSTKAKIEELSPDEGAPGDSVTLTGSGFHGSQKLTVTIGGIVAPGKDGKALDVQTQSNGNIAISFRVPAGSPEGEQTVVVADEGGATASVEFTVEKKILSTTPLPISPEDEGKLRSGEVAFHWQGVTGDTGYTYTLEISTTANSGNIWSKSGIAESSYTLTEEEALPKGTYYWRVKIVDDYGNESAWSDSIKFTVSPIPTWVWVVVGVVVLVGLMVVAYRETKFKVTE